MTDPGRAVARARRCVCAGAGCERREGHGHDRSELHARLLPPRPSGRAMVVGRPRAGHGSRGNHRLTGRRRIGTPRRERGRRLHPERQPRNLAPVDRHDERVLAGGTEDEPVEVERERGRSVSVRRGERGLERVSFAPVRVLTERHRGALRIDQAERELVLTRLGRRGPHRQSDADPVVTRGQRARGEHPPSDPEGVQLAPRCLNRVGEERVDLHAPILRGTVRVTDDDPNGVTAWAVRSTTCRTNSRSSRPRVFCCIRGRSRARPERARRSTAAR